MIPINCQSIPHIEFGCILPLLIMNGLNHNLYFFCLYRNFYKMKFGTAVVSKNTLRHSEFINKVFVRIHFHFFPVGIKFHRHTHAIRTLYIYIKFMRILRDGYFTFRVHLHFFHLFISAKLICFSPDKPCQHKNG